MADKLFYRIDSINIDMVLEIQKDIDYYDMVSLVFLLYDVPDTALQRLIVYQRVSKDIATDTMSLLYEWASHAQMRATWKFELLEALCICRMYKIIKKLDLNISSVKNHYNPNNISFSIHINPLKKILYRICESITSETLHILRRTLLLYHINTSEYETCELIFLELMCKKIVLDCNNMKNTSADFSKLTKILEHFPTLRPFAVSLNDLEHKVNNTENSLIKDMSNSLSLHNTPLKLIEHKKHIGMSYLDECYEQLNQLNSEDLLMTDKKKEYDDSYAILNPNRIGVCCIINQEEFYPSKENIHVNLSTRYGSTKDQIALQKTMAELKFEIVVSKNLSSRDFFVYLKHILQNIVLKEDSIFMLCILSHGVRGHVYAADSAKIKVEDIQTLLDSELATKLYGKPKILIIQACQVNDDPQPTQCLVADGPSSECFLRKSDFLIYWATAPEYEAFRQESKGSLFIQFLCAIIKKKAQDDHINDIFTKVTKTVIDVCSQVKKLQVPIFESTLRKKLFLHRDI